jgi:hypothetical protein
VLLRLVQDAEGTVSRLLASERDLALALMARWASISTELDRYLRMQPDTDDSRKIAGGVRWFTTYATELQRRLTTTGIKTPPALIARNASWTANSTPGGPE